MSARHHAATIALFVLLAIAHTWPLATAPARWSGVDNGDYALNAWILAWVVHQAPRERLHLFGTRFGARRDLLLRRIDVGSECQRIRGDEQVRLCRLLPRS